LEVFDLNKVFILVVVALFVISGCSNIPKSDDMQVLREAAWNSLSTQDKQEVQTVWKVAKVEVAKVSDMPIPKGGGKKPEVEHLYKVSFESNSDKTSGPIRVFVDGDTKKTVGYSKTVELNSEQQFSANDAITKVVHEKRKGFPLEASRVKGTIHGGGPAPGITIPGEFESSATKKEKDVFIVTLTEYWKAGDFRDSAEKEGTLSAFWKYEVTPNEITFLEQGGDTSPELIE
jgi:PBP1b-binding outer membrane lipoprotein LpoB